MNENQEVLTPAVVEPSDMTIFDGEDRSKKINELHKEFEQGITQIFQQQVITLRKALQIGQLLTEQKSELKHGQFGEWIENNLNFKHRTANRYMRLYKRLDESKLEDITTLKQAYEYLQMLGKRNQQLLNGKVKKNFKIIIAPDPAEVYTINSALEKAMELTKTESVSYALYYISDEWFHLNADKMKLPPIEERIKILERVYDVKLKILNDETDTEYDN